MEGIWQIAIIGLWLAFIVQCLFILALFRYLGELVRRIPRPELKVNRPAPVTTATDLGGERFTFGKPTQRPRLLLFIAPGCPACDRLVDEVPAFFAGHGPELESFVICDADEDDPATEAYARRLGPNGQPPEAAGQQQGQKHGQEQGHEGGHVRVIASRDLVSNYHVEGAPFAALLDTEGVVRYTGFVNRAAALEAAAAQVRPARREAPSAHRTLDTAAAGP